MPSTSDSSTHSSAAPSSVRNASAWRHSGSVTWCSATARCSARTRSSTIGASRSLASTAASSSWPAAELGPGPLDVALVLEQQVQGVVDGCRVEGGALELQQGAGPVDRLGDGRRLLQLQPADGPHHLRDLVGELLADLGHAGADDPPLALDVRVVDVQVQAAPAQRLRQLPGGVGGEHDQGALGAGDGAELRDGDLEVGEDLQQQRLGLDLDPETEAL